MSMTSSIYGRLAADPVARQTKGGKSMTTVNLAVDVTGRDAPEQETLWVGLLAFGNAADELLRAAKGEMVAAMGRMTRGVYTPANGEPRESWAMLCDTVVVAKSSKPTGKRPQGSARPQDRPGPTGPNPPLFDDRINF